MSAALEDTRFNAAGAVGYLVGGNMGQQHLVHRPRIAAGSRGQDHPGRQDALAGQGETQLTGLFPMHPSGRGDHLTDQIVGQQRHPQFPADHGGRLAADVVQVQRLLDVANVQLHIPAKAIQLREVLAGIRLGVRQGRDDRGA